VTAFARILVPLDGSPRAESALRWVHLLPAREVRLLQVCGKESPGRDEALRYLDDVASRLRLTGATAQTRVHAGEAAEVIVAEAADCDLIAMSTQGAGGGGRLLYGSVADRVARHAPVPTLLARGGALPIELAPLRRVVVPLDGSPAAERALPLATSLAGVLHAALHLLLVDDVRPAAELSGADLSGARAGYVAAPESVDYLEQQAQRLRAAGVLPSTEVCGGEPAVELLARVVPGDLLVITTHGRGSARRWQIGTVAERLLRQAAAPVVLVRSDSL
jgi:nucleotide-binding universal stress UspA family protein